MRAWKRWALGAAFFLTVLLALSYVGLYFLVQSSRFQQWLRVEIAKRSDYEIQLGDLRLIPPFRFVADDIVLSKSERTLLKGERISLALSFFDSFSRTLTRLELQRPTLYLDLSDLFQAPSQSSLGIAVRHLNIDKGTVVLTTGEDHSFDFHSVTMDAENLNLGQAGGLTLRTEVPWLDGRAHIDFQDHGAEKVVAIRLEQANSGDITRVLKTKRPSGDTLKAEIKLHKKDRQGLEVIAKGKLNGFRLHQESFSGHVDVHAVVDSNFDTAVFEGKVVAALPANIGPIPLNHIKEPVTATLTGKYSIPERNLTVTAFHMTSASGIADGKGTLRFKPQPMISNARVSVRKISLEVLKPLLPAMLRRGSYEGAAQADLELSGPLAALVIKGRARSQAMRFQGENLSLAQLSFQAGVTWADGSIRADDVHVSGKNLALQQQECKFSVQEMQFEGALEKKASQPVHASGKIDVSGGGFATLDGSKVGENLRLQARLDTKTHENARVTAKGTLNILEGQILWGRFFGDLKARRPSLDFDGDYVAADEHLRMRRFSLSLDNIGALNVSGNITDLGHGPTLHAQLESKDIQSAGFFEFFVRETLNRSYPIMDDLVLGGRLAFSLKTEGEPGKLSAEGRIQLHQGHVRTKSARWQIGPIDLALPFRIYYPAKGSEEPASNIQTGKLTVDSARFGGESMPPLTAIVSLWNNRFELHRPLRLPIFGGTVAISTLLWSDLINTPQSVSLSTQVKNLQLGRLTGALGWYRFDGTVSGSIPLIEWASGSLRSQGQIQADVFGGRLQISKIEIENPFLTVPAIKLDARFRDMRLEQISETFAFGRISGILEGVVDDLVITAGQPSQFRADIHSVDRPDSSQWINVEALHKLTVLSSGEDGRAAYGGLAAFFENFRYDKMGFKATLRNDKLTLRGVESKGNQEFLVVGSILPPTVNIISYTQEIGFSELVRRLERIKKSDQPQIK